MKNRIFFLADDDLDDREIFIDTLNEINKDIICITAQNGEEALNIFKRDEDLLPDYIFLDVNMPRLNGKQCLQEIKKINRLQHIPVFMYSTTILKNDMDAAMCMGAVRFITKPNTATELYDILLKLIGEG